MSCTSEWRAFCDDCYLDEEFPLQRHANEMVVYHDALFDCDGSAIKEEV